MSQNPSASSPLTARLYKLEYPRSLGVYSTYAEVQAVVDTLADNHFPVQNTMIVGTDLKLMERVTGRKTWGKVIGQGVLSGMWMGLFVGLILTMLSGGNYLAVLSSVLLGIVFFTVWSVIGYAMTGGRRDFTSMTATIPMQYELMVEHSHAQQAQEILMANGALSASAPAASPASPATGQRPVVGRSYGQPSTPQTGAGAAQPDGARQTFGRPSYGTTPAGGGQGTPGSAQHAQPPAADAASPAGHQAYSARPAGEYGQQHGASQQPMPPQAAPQHAAGHSPQVGRPAQQAAPVQDAGAGAGEQPYPDGTPGQPEDEDHRQGTAQPDAPEADERDDEDTTPHSTR